MEQAQGLSRMVEVAMSRSQQVRSPQRYCRAVLAREWEKLVSQCAPAAYPLCARHRVRCRLLGSVVSVSRSLVKPLRRLRILVA